MRVQCFDHLLNFKLGELLVRFKIVDFVLLTFVYQLFGYNFMNFSLNLNVDFIPLIYRHIIWTFIFEVIKHSICGVHELMFEFLF